MKSIIAAFVGVFQILDFHVKKENKTQFIRRLTGRPGELEKGPASSRSPLLVLQAYEAILCQYHSHSDVQTRYGVLVPDCVCKL
jgi:hypothetical protein